MNQGQVPNLPLQMAYMTMKIFYFLMVLVFSFSPLTDAFALPNILTYYKNPQTEMTQVLDAIDESKLHKDKVYTWYTGVYLHFIFEKNVEQRETLKKLAAKKGKTFKEVFSFATENKWEDLIHALQTPPQPLLNDMYWTAYHMTGDTQFLDRLVSHLDYIKDPRDPLSYMVGQTAKWSLAGNFPHDPAIRLYVEKVEKKSKGQLKKTLHEILNKPLAELREQANDDMSAALKKYSGSLPKPASITNDKNR